MPAGMEILAITNLLNANVPAVMYGMPLKELVLATDWTGALLTEVAHP